MRIFILLLILCISCTSPQDKLLPTYIPIEIVVNDTITGLINKERKERGLSILIPESNLVELSKQKCIQMYKEQEINHNGFTSLPLYTEIYGQIVGYGYENEINLFNSYMNSSEHYYIIIKPKFNYIGSYTYKTYNCILFAKY